MKERLIISVCLFYAFLFFIGCKTRNANSVQIVFFDLNNFDKTDTLLINNIDTVNSIKTLFSNMNETDAKFPRKVQITFLGKGVSEVYYSNGKYVRSKKKVYVLPDGKEFILFESIINSKIKK